MKVPMPSRQKARIEMLPLIDIVFLLLVFFIYAMLSMAVHRGLPVALPTSAQAEIEKRLILSVTVRSDGKIFIDKAPVALDALPETLKKRAAESTDPGVLLFGDRDVPYQRLFDVLDRIRAAGIDQVSLQAEKESAAP